MAHRNQKGKSRERDLRRAVWNLGRRLWLSEKSSGLLLRENSRLEKELHHERIENAALVNERDKLREEVAHLRESFGMDME